jgi:hypothetical protein
MLFCTKYNEQFGSVLPHVQQFDAIFHKFITSHCVVSHFLNARVTPSPMNIMLTSTLLSSRIFVFRVRMLRVLGSWLSGSITLLPHKTCQSNRKSNIYVSTQ